MQNKDLAEDWLRRAKSSLERTRAGKVSEEIMYEDLCFDAQQCAEKSLKALLVSLNIIFPWTHSIDTLLQLLSKAGIETPKDISMSVILTRYAVHTRYPGVTEPLTEEDHTEALKLAETVFEWARKNIEELENKLDICDGET